MKKEVSLSTFIATYIVCGVVIGFVVTFVMAFVSVLLAAFFGMFAVFVVQIATTTLVAWGASHMTMRSYVTTQMDAKRIAAMAGIVMLAFYALLDGPSMFTGQKTFDLGYLFSRLFSVAVFTGLTWFFFNREITRDVSGG